MSWRTALHATVIAFALSGALSACAIYGPCGSHECPDDATISEAVRALFRQHPELQPPLLIYVETRNHVVTLHGLVDTPYELLTAAEVARQAPGVTGVVNLIALNYQGR